MTAKHHFRILLFGALIATGAWSVGRAAEIQWEKIAIDRGLSEGCSVMDVNGDGLLDIVSLPNWYRAPFWDKRPIHDIVQSGEFLMNYGQIPIDVNSDGAMDIVSAGWYDKDIYWYENPFPKSMKVKTIGDEYKTWKRELLPQPPSLGGGCECILGVDIDGDGKTDVLPNRRPLGWYEVVKGAEGKPEFKRYPIDLSGRKSADWLHGLGFGDLNGDGRKDVISGEGWWETPKNPREEKWVEHTEFKLYDAGIPILITDLDGDGDNDFMYGHGHSYGLFWMEQTKEGDARKWVQHDIDTSATRPRLATPVPEGTRMPAISQAHVLVWVDLDGDGQNELISGKRWRGHGDDDPGSFDPLGIYYYKFDRAKKEWEKHIITHGEHIGVGMQLTVVDIDNDGDLDIVTPGKSGLFLLRNLAVQKLVTFPETIYKMKK